MDEALDVGAGPVEADNPSDMALRMPRLPASSPQTTKGARQIQKPFASYHPDDETVLLDERAA